MSHEHRIQIMDILLFYSPLRNTYADDFDLRERLVILVSRYLLDFQDAIHARSHSPKDSVFVIQTWARYSSDEELRK